KRIINKIKNWSPFKKRYIPIFSTLGFVFIVSIILIFAFPIIAEPLLSDPNRKTEKSGWPVRLAAPYIDMSSWVETSSAYSLSGAPELGKLSSETGFKYFNLGFIQPDTEKPIAEDGNIRWGWGGYYVLSKQGSGGTNAQYKGIVTSLTNLRSLGGDFAISVGGQVGAAPWVVTQNQTALENFYLDIIGTYELKRLDLDIEESNQDKTQNEINAKAIKSVQDKTNVEITLTIPIMPSGWQQKQIDIIKAYLDAGVEIQTINSMTMCYGSGVYDNEDYGTASIRAINNSIRQMKEIYSGYGINLTDEQAYLKTGATFSIGYENSLYPTFTTEMAKTVVNDAIKNNYGLISFWSMGRDAILEPNKDISKQYTYTNVLKTYNEDKK
ncbi:MAG: hypothetical protein IJA23_01780, partial [Clostridia bacterium]|nr:hypothetical protein [Clostridia bacterium]